MFEISNQTPFDAALIPGIDKEGYEYGVVVIKGAFDILNKQDSPSVSETRVPITWGDEYYGEPGSSSVKYESDTCLYKRGTDVILNGHAYAGHGKASNVEVELQVGSLKKSICVFGDRTWYRSSFGFWKFTDPGPFECIPLIYENAFGGVDTSHPDPDKHDYDKRNPVGTGFALSGDKRQLEGLRLPNLEDPQDLITDWHNRPQPAGFGVIGRDWIPRTNYAGTYDDKWQKERCPFLPQDFDDLFYQAAHPDLIAHQPLNGGESVRIVNACREGEISFMLPKRFFEISLWIKGKKTLATPSLDTVIIEPDEKRTIIIWRATIPCYRQFQYIDFLRVKERGTKTQRI